MSERSEYWWVRHQAEVQPAKVVFVGGIPVRVRMIGAAESFPAAAVELIERLPAEPEPILDRQEERPTQTSSARRGGFLLWTVLIVALVLIARLSGFLFDLLQR